MISDLSPGDKLSLKGKIFELQKKLTLIELESNEKQDYPFKPQLFTHMINGREREENYGYDHVSFMENLEKAELIKKQKKDLVRSALEMQTQENCPFKPKIYTRSRFDGRHKRDNDKPLHERLYERGEEMRRIKEERAQKLLTHDSTGRRLFSPDISKSNRPSSSSFSSPSQPFVPGAAGVLNQNIPGNQRDQQQHVYPHPYQSDGDYSSPPPPPPPPPSRAGPSHGMQEGGVVHEGYGDQFEYSRQQHQHQQQEEGGERQHEGEDRSGFFVNGGTMITADEFLYQDAKDKEERSRLRELEYEEQIAREANKRKINRQSAQLLSRKAEREARQVFAYLDRHEVLQLNYEDLQLAAEELAEAARRRKDRQRQRNKQRQHIRSSSSSRTKRGAGNGPLVIGAQRGAEMVGLFEGARAGGERAGDGGDGWEDAGEGGWTAKGRYPVGNGPLGEGSDDEDDDEDDQQEQERGMGFGEGQRGDNDRGYVAAVGGISEEDLNARLLRAAEAAVYSSRPKSVSNAQHSTGMGLGEWGISPVRALAPSHTSSPSQGIGQAAGVRESRGGEKGETRRGWLIEAAARVAGLEEWAIISPDQIYQLVDCAWSILDFRKVGSVDLASFLLVTVPLLLHHSASAALSDINRRIQRIHHKQEHQQGLQQGKDTEVGEKEEIELDELQEQQQAAQGWDAEVFGMKKIEALSALRAFLMKLVLVSSFPLPGPPVHREGQGLGAAGGRGVIGAGAGVSGSTVGSLSGVSGPGLDRAGMSRGGGSAYTPSTAGTVPTATAYGGERERKVGSQRLSSMSLRLAQKKEQRERAEIAAVLQEMQAKKSENQHKYLHFHREQAEKEARKDCGVTGDAGKGEKKEEVFSTQDILIARGVLAERRKAQLLEEARRREMAACTFQPHRPSSASYQGNHTTSYTPEFSNRRSEPNPHHGVRESGFMSEHGDDPQNPAAISFNTFMRTLSSEAPAAIHEVVAYDNSDEIEHRGGTAEERDADVDALAEAAMANLLADGLAGDFALVKTTTSSPHTSYSPSDAVVVRTHVRSGSAGSAGSAGSVGSEGRGGSSGGGVVKGSNVHERLHASAREKVLYGDTSESHAHVYSHGPKPKPRIITELEGCSFTPTIPSLPGHSTQQTRSRPLSGSSSGRTSSAGRSRSSKSSLGLSSSQRGVGDSPLSQQISNDPWTPAPCLSNSRSRSPTSLSHQSRVTAGGVSLPMDSVSPRMAQHIAKSVQRMRAANAERQRLKEEAEKERAHNEMKYTHSRKMANTGFAPFHFSSEERLRQRELARAQRIPPKMILDVKLSNTTTAKLDIRDGDHFADLARKFARIYALDADAESILRLVIQQSMEQNHVVIGEPKEEEREEEVSTGKTRRGAGNHSGSERGREGVDEQRDVGYASERARSAALHGGEADDTIGAKDKDKERSKRRNRAATFAGSPTRRRLSSDPFSSAVSAHARKPPASKSSNESDSDGESSSSSDSEEDEEEEGENEIDSVSEKDSQCESESGTESGCSSEGVNTGSDAGVSKNGDSEGLSAKRGAKPEHLRGKGGKRSGGGAAVVGMHRSWQRGGMFLDGKEQAEQEQDQTGSSEEEDEGDSADDNGNGGDAGESDLDQQRRDGKGKEGEGMDGPYVRRHKQRQEHQDHQRSHDKASTHTHPHTHRHRDRREKGSEERVVQRGKISRGVVAEKRGVEVKEGAVTETDDLAKGARSGAVTGAARGSGLGMTARDLEDRAYLKRVFIS